MQRLAIPFGVTLGDDHSHRIEAFIEWGRPGGKGGLNSYHTKTYDAEKPWFHFSARVMPHSHATVRGWFVKPEYWGQRGLHFSTGAKAYLKRPEAFISRGRFLAFAKTFLNVYCELRQLRTAPKPTVNALCLLEMVLRQQNRGNSDPSLMNHLTFQRAVQFLEKSKIAKGGQFDIGKALEHIAMLIQGGGRFKGDKIHASFPGFRLINASFSFRSPIKLPPKRVPAYPIKAQTSARPGVRKVLSGEEVAAVGLAYRRSVDRTGLASLCTFVASLLGLTLTTASLRASELQALRYDALFCDPLVAGRMRIRVARPKVGVEQIVPIPRKLNGLAQELFGNAVSYSSEARDAFASYIEQSPLGTDGIQSLFIPKRLRHLFRPEHLTASQVEDILEVTPKTGKFSRRVARQANVYFVQREGDIYAFKPTPQMKAVHISRIRTDCKRFGWIMDVPLDARGGQYVQLGVVSRWIHAPTKSALREYLHKLYASREAKRVQRYLPRDVLHEYLLEQFKKLRRFPHWPYTTKDRNVRLDHALLTCFAAGQDTKFEPGDSSRAWWLPNLLSIGTLNTWISGNGRGPAFLFRKMEVSLENGKFPSISIHQTRKFHHTEALLAGASPPFIDELAGRKSGWQSTHYDYRTPRQVLLQSIETFDPDEDFNVLGPIADQAPPPSKVVARMAFFQANAAPKHVTEIGGCRTDWSLNPCRQFGDCIRCDSHVWRKGDLKRLPVIRQMKTEALEAIVVGKKKLRASSRSLSIAKQVRQLQETVQRCDQILEMEEDNSIPAGTIVTFNAAPTAMSDAARMSLLRSPSSNYRKE